MAKEMKKEGRIKAFFKSRKAKKGSVAVIILASALAAVILLNVLAGLLVKRFPNLRFDMTAKGTYQLQEDTRDYLTQLDRDITINVLVTESTFKSGLNAYSGAEYFVQADELLRKMEALNKKIKLNFIDLTKNPSFTNQEKFKDIDWQSKDNDTLIIIESGERYSEVALSECFTYDEQMLQYYGYYEYTSTTIEQAVVTGILKVVVDEMTQIDFITDFGEGEEAYGALVDLLKKNAYKVNEVNPNTADLNESSTIAVLFAPSADLTKEVAAKIEKWLDNDGEYGRTFIYIPKNAEVKSININALIENYGMKVSDGFAFCKDSNHTYLGDARSFYLDYNNTDFEENLKGSKFRTVTGDSRDIEITDDSIATPLLSVNSKGNVGVIPADATGEINLKDYVKDGAINCAAIGRKQNNDGEESCVAVFGSPVMLQQSVLENGIFNNANYFVNFCNIVTGRGDMGVTIVSNQTDNGQLGEITAGTVTTAKFFFIGFIPVSVLLIGLIVFLRRRTK